MGDSTKSGLNVNAPAFIPRVGAAAFVPGQSAHPITPDEPSGKNALAHICHFGFTTEIP